MATAQVVKPKVIPTVAKPPVKTVTPQVVQPKALTPKATTPVKAPTVQPQAPAMPQYKAPDPFSFNYNYMTQDSANQQAEQQFNPLFEQAVKGVKAQQYQNTLDSGQSSAVRGLAHSGLAQDALTKIAIASQGQISGLNAQKMSDVARTAQEMLARDQARGDSLRAQQFAEYQSNRDFGYGQYRDSVGDSRYDSETAYNHGRDAVADKQWQSQFDYNKAVDDRGYNYQVGRDKINDTRYTDETKYNRGIDSRDFNYQVGRDKVGDSQWNQQFQHGKAQDALAESWRQKEWNQMSPAEKQREALNLANSLKLKGASGGGRGGSKGSSSSKSGLTQKGPQKLDMDPNKLAAILDTMGKITPTYGTQGYYDKMKNLQY